MTFSVELYPKELRKSLASRILENYPDSQDYSPQDIEDEPQQG